jgi:hypothetical protein
MMRDAPGAGQGIGLGGGFLIDNGLVDHILPPAAVFRGETNADIMAFAHLPQQFKRILVFPVHGQDRGSGFLFKKGPGFPSIFLFFFGIKDGLHLTPSLVTV